MNHENSFTKTLRPTKSRSPNYSITNETTKFCSPQNETSAKLSNRIQIEVKFPNFKGRPETKLISAIAENTLLPYRLPKNERERFRDDRKCETQHRRSLLVQRSSSPFFVKSRHTGAIKAESLPITKLTKIFVPLGRASSDNQSAQ